MHRLFNHNVPSLRTPGGQSKGLDLTAQQEKDTHDYETTKSKTQEREKLAHKPKHQQVENGKTRKAKSIFGLTLFSACGVSECPAIPAIHIRRDLLGRHCLDGRGKNGPEYRNNLYRDWRRWDLAGNRIS
jgi:hypothetical protein